MLGDAEGFEHNILDLKSLLFNAKLNRSNKQLALLKIHNEISENFQPGQKPSIVHLLHAAFLIRQQVSRGFSVRKAFETACVDVYLKARFVNHGPMRQRMISLIEETTDQLLPDDGDDEAQLDLDSVTWNTNNLQESSLLTVIRQHGSIIAAIVDAGRRTTGFLNSLLAAESEKITLDIDVAEIMPYILLNFYQTSSKNDSGLRFLWLSKILSTDFNDFKELDEKNSALADVISNFKFRSASPDLPWDPGYSPESLGNNLQEIRLSDANRLTTILYIVAMGMRDDKLLEELTLSKDETIITVLQYSNCVYHGKKLNDIYSTSTTIHSS